MNPNNDMSDYYDYYTQLDMDRYAQYHEYFEQYASLEGDEGQSSERLSRRYIPREREVAEEKLRRDYFGDDNTPPIYPEEYFRRREDEVNIASRSLQRSRVLAIVDVVMVVDMGLIESNQFLFFDFLFVFLTRVGDPSQLGQNARNPAGYNDVIGNQVIQNAVQNPRIWNVGNHNGLIEEYDLMAAVADLDEIEEVNANYILMANLQQASTSENKAYWALKHVNFDLKIAGDHRKLQLNELCDQACENSLIYKEKTKKIHDSKIKNRIFNVGDQVLLFNSHLKIFLGKLKTRWSGPFTITKVFPYGTVELCQRDGPNFKVNGHRVKHYFGGDVPQLVVSNIQTFPMDK
nr:reverse transcriptase domain-containing protein [Tanacetum cinerariifolium]